MSALPDSSGWCDADPNCRCVGTTVRYSCLSYYVHYLAFERVAHGGNERDRHNADVPKRLPIAVPTPMSVNAATQAFGSELRVQLLRFYAATPSRQADAVRALGVERPVVQSNTAALATLGVLVRQRDRSYSVDRKRVRELLRALEEFQLPPETD